MKGEGLMAKELDIGQYLEEICRFPLLTAAQERTLARRIRKHGDSASRQEMIRCNLRLVVSIARRYCRKGVALIDLVAEGNVGLVRAVDLFDPDKEVRFSTYATWWVRQAICRALMLHGHPIHLPVYMNQRIARLRGECNKATDENGEVPLDSDMATQMNISVAMIAAARRASSTMYAATLIDPTGEHSESFYELLEDTRTPAPEKAAEESELAAMIEVALNKLPQREAFILRLRNGIGVNGTFTLDQIAARLDVTRERVRQIEISALRKLSRLLQGQEHLLERTARNIRNGVRQTVMV